MSIRVDVRAGSVELEEPLKAVGLPVEMGTLPAGDVEIDGRGPGGRVLPVGVEFKTMRDMLACVRSGRFAEQLRGMRDRYEVSWLLIEGEWEATEGGLLAVRERKGLVERGRYTPQEAVSWTLTMAQRGGALLWRTANRSESVAWLRALYWWWTSKDFEDHRAHLDWFRPPVTTEAPWEEPSLVLQVASILPGIGADRARAADAEFGSVREMVNADEAQWRCVQGVGPKTAKRVVAAVGG